MPVYVFYVRGDDVEIIRKDELTDLKRSELKQRGFKKYHLEVEAASKKDAAVQLNKSTHENLEDLRSFSGSHLFAAVFIVFALVLAYFNL